MSERETKNVKDLKLRAQLPQIVRYAALGLLAVSALVVIVGFYRGGNNSGFKLKSEHTQLSTDVTAEVNGYERLESDDGVSKYYVKADRAKTFADDHQELENAYFEIYDSAGALAEKMTAQRVIYIPEENKNFVAYMKGDVNIETVDSLKIKTNNIIYTKSTGTVEADELVHFDRVTVRGHSLGATVKMLEKRLDMLKDVEIETFESPENARSGIRYSKINAGSASYDQVAQKIDLRDNVAFAIDSKSSSGNATHTDVTSGRAVAFLAPIGSGVDGSAAHQVRLQSFELFDSVKINSSETGGSPTDIESGYAMYDKDADRYELRNAVHIVTAANSRPTDIRSDDAVYHQAGFKVSLSGNAAIQQGSDRISGQTIDADLFPDRKLKYAVIRGGGTVKQTGESRVTVITAPEINAAFGDSRQLLSANTLGQSEIRLIPEGKAEYSSVTMSAPRAIHAVFKGAGLLERIQTDGRTTIRLDVPNSDANAASKQLTADKVNTFFADSGADIRKAEAIGNAELHIEPLRAGENNYRTTINAPRFDCDFFVPGNNARVCIGGKKTKTVRVPTVSKKDRGTQTVTSDQLTASFSQQSKDIDRLDAIGNAKFNELDRNAKASEMSFTGADSMIRLRGGEPTVWDDRGRAVAREIDMNTGTQRSHLRGGVSTTYYSRRSMSNAAPFASADKPVFITGESAEIDHTTRVAVYTGNARGWQDNNFVRGDRLTIDEKDGKMFAEGNVQSAIYNARTRKGGRESVVPVFAAARTMLYERDARIVRYRESVDIRQGTDRMTAASADIYLNENNELARTVAEISVVVTQPGRRATGKWIQYSASDEVAILRGDPASVSDSANGTSTAAELTFMMRENRLISEGKTKSAASGRIRSTYKIDPKP